MQYLILFISYKSRYYTQFDNGKFKAELVKELSVKIKFIPVSQFN